MPHCCPLLATEGNYLRGRNGEKTFNGEGRMLSRIIRN